DARGERRLLDQHRVGGGGAGPGREVEHRLQGGAQLLGAERPGGPAHACVPPTVRPSMRIVGRPTPTGTDWPFLAQVPMPSSRARSCPTMLMRVRTSGPLPIRVAPFTGRVTAPCSIRYASLAEKTNLPLVMSTWPPPKDTA